MTTNVVGLVLGVTFVVCTALILATLGGVVRENEQGGRTAVAPASYIGRELPSRYIGPPKPTAYAGRHRRDE